MQQTFIFFGRSGSGKGTQAEMLKKYIQEKKGIEPIYIETGQKFRNFIDQSNYSASLTKEVMSSGGLLPDFLPIWIWTTDLVTKFDGKRDLILDGLCRRPDEAPVLDSAVKFYKLIKPIVLYIKTSDEWSFERLKGRGRSDDSDEYIKSRLKWFEWNVVPAMAYFYDNEEYYFFEINGEQSVEDVHKEIISKIESISK
jgi:adenylate kinase